MLKLFPYDSRVFEKGISLPDAYNVRVTREINGGRMLEFSYPLDEKSEIINENKIVLCEGQAYRIIKTRRSSGDASSLEAQCHHVYNADAPNIHLANVPDMIGVNPSAVIESVFEGSAFSLISDEELELLGMRRVDYDGFKIDFFSTDKTNPFEVVKNVIESCGKGELYADNYRIALVERIGHSTNVRLDLTKNMSGISVERDITDMVTVLTPYGKSDAVISSVNGGVPYIRSANADIYGEKQGYADYSDYTEPEKIMRRALWEFDSANEDRIDVPCVNITGSLVDISKLSEYGESERINLGDGVTVVDNGNEIKERVIKMEYYPYQSGSTVISIGRVKRDLFFYLEQMGRLARRYGKVSTRGGKVRAQSIAGVISNSGIKLSSDSGELSLLSDLLRISSSGTLKAMIGNENGKFVCMIKDNGGKTALNLNNDGAMEFTGIVNADRLTAAGKIIGINADGELCIDGKAIVTKEEP